MALSVRRRYLLYCANVLHGLPLESSSIHHVVTSPPYWKMRDYRVAGQIGWEEIHDCLGWATGSPCGKCYVCHIVQAGQEIWRVLRKDGTWLLNIGDTYAARRSYQVPDNKYKDVGNSFAMKPPPGLKIKDAIGIPWRVALALQANGWHLRGDIIWSKGNPYPESVADRCSRSHEHIFHLSKSPHYFWDSEAIMEESSDPEGSASRYRYGFNKHAAKSAAAGESYDDGDYRLVFEGQREFRGMRNRRDVWTINTSQCHDPHFAPFPPKLPRLCIMAGTSERGVCPVCGAPWKRVIEASNNTRSISPVLGMSSEIKATPGAAGSAGYRQVETIEWVPTCTCNRAGLKLKPTDMEVIGTPTGESAGEDPSVITGRGGFNRPRGESEGRRNITRYEQRMYAAQLRRSPWRKDMEEQAGTAFAHYIRTDHSGARPVPQDLLDDWIGLGWIDLVGVPSFDPFEPVPAIVLDPFCGRGTSGIEAIELGRRWIGGDLSEPYLALANKNLAGARNRLL